MSLRRRARGRASGLLSLLETDIVRSRFCAEAGRELSVSSSACMKVLGGQMHRVCGKFTQHSEIYNPMRRVCGKFTQLSKTATHQINGRVFSTTHFHQEPTRIPKKTPSTALTGNMVNSATCKLSIRQHARSEGSSCGRHRLEWRYQDVGRGSKSPPDVMLVFGVGLGDGLSAGRAAGCPLVSGTRFMSPANVPPLPASALRVGGLVAAGPGPTPGEE